MKHKTIILSLAVATCLAFSACGESTNEKSSTLQRIWNFMFHFGTSTNEEAETEALQTEEHTFAQEPVLTLTSNALGEWKLGDRGKTLPETFEGLYDKLEYFENFDEMDGIMERQYTATLKGEHTVAFHVDENKNIDFIIVKEGAPIAIKLHNGKILNPWETTVGELLAEGGKAEGNWPYAEMILTLDKMVFGFYSEVITNPEESESCGPLKASDLDTTAKPNDVTISIYK